MVDDDYAEPSAELPDQGACKSDNSEGRPKGSRNRLGRAFLEAVQADFAAHGVGVITRIREEKPESYLKLVASMLPKDLNLNINAMDDLTDEQLIERIRTLDAAIRPLLNRKQAGGSARGPRRAPRAKS